MGLVRPLVLGTGDLTELQNGDVAYVPAMSVGVANPAAYLHIAASTGTAGTAPLKLSAGVNLTAPEAGAIEFDGTHFYGTIGSTRYQLDQQGSGAISDLYLTNTTHADQHGIIYKTGSPFLHDFNYGDNGTVTTVGFNIFLGSNAGNFSMGSTATSFSMSSYNIGIGANALQVNTTGSGNVVMGSDALRSNTTGSYNTAIGRETLRNNTIGNLNVAISWNALQGNTEGDGNSAIGVNSLWNNTTGDFNIGVGDSTLFANTTGERNVGIGNNALARTVTSSGSVGIGSWAGTLTTSYASNLSSTNCVYIGTSSRPSASGNTNEIVIGYNAAGHGSNTVTIGNSSVSDLYFGNTLINIHAGSITVEDDPYSASWNGDMQAATKNALFNKFESLPDAGIALTDLSAAAPLQFNNTTGQFSIPVATASVNGYLSSTDWSTFNSMIPLTQKGAANGVVPLGADSLIPSAYLPSYVDDVLEYADQGSFPVTGESGKIYIALDSNKQYRWSGSTYIEISSGAVQSVNGQTGIVTLTTAHIAASTNKNYVTDAQLTVIQNTSGNNTGDQNLSNYALKADYVAKSLFDANTIIYASADNAPLAMAIGYSTLVGRKASGAIAAMSAEETRTVLGAGTAYWNAKYIASKEVNDTEIADQSVLTYDQTADKIIYTPKGAAGGTNAYAWFMN